MNIFGITLSITLWYDLLYVQEKIIAKVKPSQIDFSSIYYSFMWYVMYIIACSNIITCKIYIYIYQKFKYQSRKFGTLIFYKG